MPVDTDRPKNTARAAGVFHEHIRRIASGCASALPEEIVVAEVAADLAFAGVHVLPRPAIRNFILSRRPGGWTLTFAPKTSLEEIEGRCLRLGSRAYKRWKLSASWQRNQQSFGTSEEQSSD